MSYWSRSAHNGCPWVLCTQVAPLTFTTSSRVPAGDGADSHSRSGARDALNLSSLSFVVVVVTPAPVIGQTWLWSTKKFEILC